MRFLAAIAVLTLALASPLSAELARQADRKPAPPRVVEKAAFEKELRALLAEKPRH